MHVAPLDTQRHNDCCTNELHSEIMVSNYREVHKVLTKFMVQSLPSNTDSSSARKEFPVFKKSPKFITAFLNAENRTCSEQLNSSTPSYTISKIRPDILSSKNRSLTWTLSLIFVN